ncbi:hypothetical protein ILYODFUR_007371 [Ilyodon furcidens]|uniref:Uncharacterized protein n=1 Tax=Ilyodon furcidens TaxID=33524 RepID=A0ABV0T7D2_9TELE
MRVSSSGANVPSGLTPIGLITFCLWSRTDKKNQMKSANAGLKNLNAQNSARASLYLWTDLTRALNLFLFIRKLEDPHTNPLSSPVHGQSGLSGHPLPLSLPVAV